MREQWDERSQRSTWRRYGVAVLVVFLATLLSLALHPWLAPVPLAPFLAAVALAAWYGGAGPAVATIGLSLPPISLVAMMPMGVWSLSTADQVAIAIFVAVSSLLVLISISRDRAAFALHTSEQRFRTMLATANEGVWQIDLQARTQFANDRMASLLGTTLERVQHGTVLDFVFPDDLPRARERIGVNLEGQPEVFDFQFRRTDGDAVHVLASTNPVHSASGVVGALWLVTDITARKRAEEALRESEARARFLAEASAILAATFDSDEAVQQVVSLAVPRMADWCVIDLLREDGALHRLAVIHGDPARSATAEALLAANPTISQEDSHTAWGVLHESRPWFDPEVDLDRFAVEARGERHLALLRQLGFASELIVPLLGRDHALGVLTLVQGDSGRQFGPEDVPFAEELARHCALAIDNARLYREARAAQAKISRLFDTGVIGLLVADEERILEANDRFLHMVGYSRDDLAAGRLRWREMTPPGFEAADAQALAELAAQGLCTPFEKEYLRKDGGHVPILLGAVAVEGRTPPWIGAVIDLTAQKMAERDRVAFIDAATHDLKNPLTSLRGRTQLLQRHVRRVQPPDIETLEAGLQAIDADGNRIVQLIDEMMDAAHLSAGRVLELRPAPVDVIALVETAVEEARRGASGRLIRVEAAGCELVGTWDPVRLARVLANLLSNALKYSPADSEVVVRVGQERSPDGTASAFVAVRDEGVGIPAADFPRLFERFYRGANVAGRTHGTGIGLAGARQIVEQHGGTIVVESEEGQGSTFTVRLPLVPADPPEDSRISAHDPVMPTG